MQVRTVLGWSKRTQNWQGNTIFKMNVFEKPFTFVKERIKHGGQKCTVGLKMPPKNLNSRQKRLGFFTGGLEWQLFYFQKTIKNVTLSKT